ncbi:MAG: regulatory iron-sulfur-containing complex subunit RicT [Candidatus Zapsychrus exili]|nr:regulatory iron-sulfur-containing complex subunit RicT [Candidatus Zapsychrus exili]
MEKIIEVQLGEYRPVFLYDLNGIEYSRGDYVILEVSRGSEFGKVVSNVDVVLDEQKQQKINGKILRKATEGDLKQIENNRTKAKDAFSVCIRKITDRKLQMQIVKAEYTFDSSKIIFFFTAEGRVDFRNLVKDLAKVFRVRIELRQIGVRDKAKIIGGCGICGKGLCCSSYMKDFHPLSVKMAKEQGLPLNPSRISGACGRIKCCMSYEFNVYKELSKSLPKLGEKINTDEGKGKVVEVNVFKKYVIVDLGEGRTIKMTFGKKNEQ